MNTGQTVREYRTAIIGLGIASAVMIGAALIAASNRSGGHKPEEALYSAGDLAACEKVIEDGGRVGLIKGEPSSTRLDVEDRLWTEMPAETKRGVLQALACRAYRRPLRWDEYVVAYGYRSGKRLAMLSTEGVSFE